VSADEQFAAAWLAELWPVCREWHQTRDERLDAEARNAYAQRNAQPGDDTPVLPEKRAS